MTQDKKFVGVIMAGGFGSRLTPTTFGVSKHLLQIYDKPLIYYPLSVLMLGGISDILIVVNPHDLGNYKRLLGDGSRLGLNLTFIVQPKPGGIAQCFELAEREIGSDNVCLILGDNIYWGVNFGSMLKNALASNDGATIFSYRVNDPSRFGVVEFDSSNSVVSIEEKPINPKSNFAITGLYIYENEVVNYAKNLRPSDRGELEITDINNIFLQKKKLQTIPLGRGFAWLDTGTHRAMSEASTFIEAIQNRQGFIVACLEEIAFRNGWISEKDILKYISETADTEYSSYLKGII